MILKREQINAIFYAPFGAVKLTDDLSEEVKQQIYKVAPTLFEPEVEVENEKKPVKRKK